MFYAAALQDPETSGDARSHSRGVGRVRGFGVGWGEWSCDQQLQEAETFSVHHFDHGCQLHIDFHAGEHCGIHVGNHFTPDL